MASRSDPHGAGSAARPVLFRAERCGLPFSVAPSCMPPPTLLPPFSSGNMDAPARHRHSIQEIRMSHAPPPERRLPPALPITLAVIVLGVIGLVILGPRGPQAQAESPKATAGFQTVDDLVLAVDLPAIAKGNRPELTVELLDRNGDVLESQTPKLPGNEAASLRVAFKRPKEKLGNIKVRLTSGKKTSEVTIGDILLTKAHETTLAASSEMFAGSKAAMRCSVAGVKSVTETVPLSAEVTVKL